MRMAKTHGRKGGMIGGNLVTILVFLVVYGFFISAMNQSWLVWLPSFGKMVVALLAAGLLSWAIWAGIVEMTPGP